MQKKISNYATWQIFASIFAGSIHIYVSTIGGPDTLFVLDTGKLVSIFFLQYVSHNFQKRKKKIASVESVCPQSRWNTTANRAGRVSGRVLVIGFVSVSVSVSVNVKLSEKNMILLLLLPCLKPLRDSLST